MDFLRDTSLQAVIGILGIVATAIFFLLQRKKKRLIYTIITETPMLSVNDEVKGKIKIKYGTKNIQNLYLVLLKVANSGNVHVASSDYEKPITFSFPDAEILSAEVTEVSPKSLKPVIVVKPSSLMIDPILLNSKDNFVCKLIFSNYIKKIEADGRIVGIREIERIDEKDNKNMRQFLVVIAFSPWLILLYLGLSDFLYSLSIENRILYLDLILTLGFIVAITFLVILVREKRKQ